MSRTFILFFVLCGLCLSVSAQSAPGPIYVAEARGTITSVG